MHVEDHTGLFSLSIKTQLCFFISIHGFKTSFVFATTDIKWLRCRTAQAGIYSAGDAQCKLINLHINTYTRK